FRELEYLLGLKEQGALSRYPAGSPQREGLERRLAEPTLWDAFLQYLSASGYAVPKALLERDVRAGVASAPVLHPVLIEPAHKDPAHGALVDRRVDLYEGFQESRYRHVKMVERTIGTKRGTGGSEGAAYLRTTLNKPFFPDLWAIRTEL